MFPLFQLWHFSVSSSWHCFPHHASCSCSRKHFLLSLTTSQYSVLEQPTWIIWHWLPGKISCKKAGGGHWTLSRGASRHRPQSYPYPYPYPLCCCLLSEKWWWWRLIREKRKASWTTAKTMPYQRRPYPKSAKQRAASQVIACCTSKTSQATQSPVESWGQFSPPSPTRLALCLLWLPPNLTVPLESTGLVIGLKPGRSFSPIFGPFLKMIHLFFSIDLF